MRFVTFDDVVGRFKNKRIAVVGSAPSCLDNEPGMVDSHDVVVRVNNFKLGPQQGTRTDVHHSFYGSSIRVNAETLQASGVTLCMCKCPDAKAIECEWHERMNKPHGIDYRYIYKNRRTWWFCDTFVPTVEHFLVPFNLLGRHQPTSGFAAVFDMLLAEPRSLYLTGFDFFSSGRHNVNEVWRPGDPEDPICHRPDLEAKWLFENVDGHPLLFDKKLAQMKTEYHRKAKKEEATHA